MKVTEPLLDISCVSYHYEVSHWQLQSISMSIGQGDFVGIVGPNGSGKSTLLKLGAGMLEPDAGSVLLKGRAMDTLSRRAIARTLGFLPQTVTVSFDHTVEEVIAMGRFCRLQGLGFISGPDQEVIERCMTVTESGHLRTRRLSQLSGGERQRVLLASVLAQEPCLLLLDEPTTGLDLHHQVAFFRMLGQLVSQGMGVVVVTHDLNLTGQFCERLLLMVEGRVLTQGTVEQVMTKDILTKVYPEDLMVCTHPVNGRPMIIPIR
jgi:iron complex transport system ATP-binding protein